MRAPERDFAFLDIGMCVEQTGGAGGIGGAVGLNLTQEGDTIFATWFTYDVDHTPVWLVATLNKSGRTIYSGDLIRLARGPAFNAVPFPPIGSPGGASGTTVGIASVSFFDGLPGGLNSPFHQL
ncbi:MAG TPA: hypothetical protein VGK37_07150 [Casimicrobiaceae bacterium]|jgi:hypothetical protein